ncbi:MAG: hypothetical protein WC546_03255 [Candidatus Omnitrophota bacterium]
MTKSEELGINKIKQLIWIYVFLLIFEGAIRRWLLYSIREPLLLIRDPFVLWIYLLAIKSGVFPNNKFMQVIIFLGIISFLVSLTSPVSNLLVSLYGWRTNFLHLPLIFLIPKVFNIEDVKKIGRWILIFSIPVAFIMVMQFNSGRDSFWNRSLTGEYDQLSSALGKGRPPGSFSFSTGPTLFFPFVTVFLLYSLFKRNLYSTSLVLASSVSVLIAMSVSGNRGLVVSVIIVCAATLFIFFSRPSLTNLVLKFLIIIFILVIFVSSLGIVNEGVRVLSKRFSEAGGIERGIKDRILGGLTQAVSQYFEYPIFGYGLGTGTNVGSVLMTTKRGKTFVEDEWSRNLYEGGLVLGMLYILLRMALTFYLFKESYKCLASLNILPLLIFASCGTSVLFGQIGQANILGFAVLGGGLCLAAARVSKEDAENNENINTR